MFTLQNSPEPQSTVTPWPKKRHGNDSRFHDNSSHESLTQTSFVVCEQRSRQRVPLVTDSSATSQVLCLSFVGISQRVPPSLEFLPGGKITPFHQLLTHLRFREKTLQNGRFKGEALLWTRVPSTVFTCVSDAPVLPPPPSKMNKCDGCCASFPGVLQSSNGSRFFWCRKMEGNLVRLRFQCDLCDNTGEYGKF